MQDYFTESIMEHVVKHPQQFESSYYYFWILIIDVIKFL
jgi:hypothetical protein